MEFIEEKSLRLCMEHAKVYAMPKELNPNSERIWARAFVKVMKVDCSISYCIAKNDGYGSPHIMRDFGNAAGIVKILGIYPFDYMKKGDIPDMKKPSEIAIYLIGNGCEKKEVMSLMSDKTSDNLPKSEEQLKADIDTIKKMVMRTAICNYNDRKEIEENE